MNPQAFGKYQLIKKLATGGMAEVWLAKQTGIEGFKKEVVVKRILPHLADDPEFVHMFLNEAKIAARFTHPNIAQIFEFGRDEPSGTYFIAMEFIRGEDLGRVMRKAWSSGQWIARPLAIRIVAACCEGLYYAHTQSDERGVPLRVVHRDISPQNILISFDGGVKLVDFGIAKAADQASMTKSGAIKGKFAYMSPEQAAGKPLDHRSDIFAIGLVLYELLTGVRPLKRDSELGTLQAALECAIEAPSAVADVPGELDDVVMHALTKAADDRYRDARMFQMALEEFLVAQRWVASSVQISELMETLFADRIAEERRLGHPNPPEHDGQSSQSLPPAPAVPPRSRSGMSKTANPPAPQMGGAAAAKAEDWSAPPNRPTQPNDTKPMSSLRRPSQEAVPAASDENWEAPPGEMQKGARVERRNSLSNAPMSPAATRAAKATSSRPSNPAVRRQTQQPPTVDPGESTEMADESDDLPPPPSEPPKRRTSTANRQAAVGQYSLNPQRKATGEMPEAPPPRVREETEEEADDRKRRNKIQAIDDQIERSERRERNKSLIRNAFAALLIFGALGGAWMARDKIVSLLKPKSQYFVTADSNLPVTVKVRHKPSEGIKEEEVLGTTPLHPTAGIHPGDTVILESKVVGAYIEQKVDDSLGLGETAKVTHEFKKGRLRLKISPEKKVGSLQVLRDGQQVGTFPGLDIELVEGKHMLELRGNRLKKPAMVEVNVKGNSTVDSKTFDLAAVVTD